LCFSFSFVTPFFSGNSPIRFEKTKADSVASGSAYLANNCASLAKRHQAAKLRRLAFESDLADQLKELTARIREDWD
jgi:hypothetical protein